MENKAGRTNSGRAKLTVYGPPTITQHPSDQTINEGATATFSVSATTVGGTLSYQWQQRGKTASSKFKNMVAKTSPTLTLTNVSVLLNSYEYRCKVSNPAGSTFSQSARLTVRAKPKITVHPVSQTAVKGTSVSFSGTAHRFQAQLSTAYRGRYIYVYGRDSDNKQLKNLNRSPKYFPYPPPKSFTPTDDAWVRADYPSRNYGSVDKLLIRPSGSGHQAHAYLRFNVTGINGKITKATPYIRIAWNDIKKLSLFQITDWSWSEGALTYNNASLNAVWSKLNIVAPVAWVAIDVTPVVKSVGRYTFGIVHGDGDFYRHLSSKESSSPPQPEITYQ